MHLAHIEAIERAFDIPKFNSFSEFLESGFELNREDRFGTFKLEYTPWLRTVAKWLDTPGLEWISLIQGSQTGKTTLQMAFLLYVSQLSPCRILWVQSTEEEAKTFITERLRPYIDGYDSEAIAKRSWKIEAFRVFKARVKVGYASNDQSLKTVPVQYVIGDECAMWKHPISLVKKRTRTFTGTRKGIFATTPPKNGEHFSWQEAKEADFFQWCVPCPKCGQLQAISMSGLKWEGKQGNSWNYDTVRATTYYECAFCRSRWYEKDKLAIIGKGKEFCVDPDDGYKPKKESEGTAKTLQISALYSIFTDWGEEACQFLKAKHAGVEELKIFITDELAESPTNLEEGEKLKDNDLNKYISLDRQSGFMAGYDLYTAGVDVQRLGQLYIVLVGWKRGVIPTGHVLKADVVAWSAGNFQLKWAEFLAYVAPFIGFCARVALDSTDGMVSQDIFDFCHYAGRQYIALKDSTTLHIKTFLKHIAPEVHGKKVNRQQLVLVVNSDKIKDDLAASFNRPPGEVGAWNFPVDIAPDFMKALTLEHRITEKSGKSSWKPVYAHAPNHFFSALVYATAAMEEFRALLCAPQVGQVTKTSVQRMRSAGVKIW